MTESADHGGELLVGTWIRCGEQTLLPASGSANEVGIEFAADGIFYRIYEEGGALIRAEGLLQQGDWRLLDFGEPGRLQLNLTVLGSGTHYTNPEFFGTPTVLLRAPKYEGPDPAEFVPWTGAAPQPGVPKGAGDASCGVPTDPIVLESVAVVEQLLPGTWVRCSEDSALGPVQNGEVGIEITADGRFFRLYEDTRGGLILASGGDQEGTWAVIEVSIETPIAYYAQVNFSGGSGTFIHAATFLQQPRHLRLDGRGLPGLDRCTAGSG